jgi:hypothetical protein
MRYSTSRGHPGALQVRQSAVPSKHSTWVPRTGRGMAIRLASRAAPAMRTILWAATKPPSCASWWRQPRKSGAEFPGRRKPGPKLPAAFYANSDRFRCTRRGRVRKELSPVSAPAWSLEWSRRRHRTCRRCRHVPCLPPHPPPPRADAASQYGAGGARGAPRRSAARFTWLRHS